uniref:Pro-neuregulin-4, membrane-bound isoform n=1 Tax=Meleagris gallopavo TaxID=9103 RepID=G1MWN1_MELGA
MRTDHEELCGTSYGSFCLNGGICYMIPTVPSPFCRCIENYTGARCEEVLLPSIKSQTKGKPPLQGQVPQSVVPTWLRLQAAMAATGYVTRAKRSQVIWSVSLSPLMTQREWLGTERHRKHDLNSPTFISFLPLEVVTRKNKMYLYSSTSPSSPLCGIHHVVLKKKLEKISGSEREENAECRFLISEIREKKVCKNKGGKENVNKSQFLGCLLHALASEKVVCILHTRRCKYSKTKKKRQSVTVYTVRSQGENRNVAAIRKQQRKMYYFLRTHVKKLEYE